MYRIKNFLMAIGPFSNRSNSRAEYIIQKLLAFMLIFAVSAGLVEAGVILGFTLFGYDVLKGVLPDSPVVGMLPLYGYILFALLTVFYVKRIEKRPLSDMRFRLDKKSLLLFAVFLGDGILLVALLVACFVLSGVFSFAGFGDFSGTSVMWLLAFIIQGSGEELMCRGFFQNAMERRISRPAAIALSALLFILPHVSSLMEMTALQMIVSIVNLALVSIVFSFLMIKTGSVLSACGLHAGWNFALGIIFGTNVSGMSASEGMIRLTVSQSPALVSGGVYGIEASIFLIPVLLFAAMICYLGIRRGEK
jgi:uncharacterized protein